MPASVATRGNRPRSESDRVPRSRSFSFAVKGRGHDAAHRLAKLEQRDEGQDDEGARPGQEIQQRIDDRSASARCAQRVTVLVPASVRRAGFVTGSVASRVTIGPTSDSRPIPSNAACQPRKPEPAITPAPEASIANR